MKRYKPTNFYLTNWSSATSKEVQAYCVGNVVERTVPAFTVAGHAHCIYTVLWARHGALHHLPVLWKPGVQFLPGIDERRHELADVKRWHHQQSQCAQVYVFAQPQCFVTDQFRPEFDCVFPVRHIGWCSDSNQFCAIDLSDSLPGCFQHRRGVGFVSTVRLFPGYQLFIRNFHDASFLFFRHLLYR